MEKRILEEFNHWWLTSKVDPELALPFKREIYAEVSSHFQQRFILALVGLRRVGKTTLLYQLIEHLLSSGVKPENILFFSFDEKQMGLPEVLETYKEIQRKDFRQERIYLFLDEIQKCVSWERELKKYYDLYPQIKFVISGSESLFVRKKSKETLAGRLFEFLLWPFSFTEYLKLHHIRKEELYYQTKISPLLLNYVQRGGFPETFAMKSDYDFKEYLRSLVVDKIVYKDIPLLFKIEDPQFLLTLFELIALHPGMFIDYLSLSKQYGKDRRVVRDYIMYLEKSFLIRVLGNYRKGTVTLRKRKKAYPTDTAFIYLFISQQDASFFGHVVETVIGNLQGVTAFWKNGYEVDFIFQQVPIEVKYQETLVSEDVKGVRAFMEKFGVEKGIIITKNEEKEFKTEKGMVYFIPLWKFLLDKEKIFSS